MSGKTASLSEPYITFRTLEIGDSFSVRTGETAVLWMRLGVLVVDIRSENRPGFVSLLGNDFLFIGKPLECRISAAHDNAPIVLIQIDRFSMREALKVRPYARLPSGTTEDALKVLNYPLNVYHYPDTRNMIACMEFIISDFSEGIWPANESCILTDTLRLFWYTRKLPEESFAPLSTASNASAVAWVMKYVRSEYKTATLKEAAKILHYNPDYLSILMQKVSGRSFSSLLNLRRFIVARTLLIQTNAPLKDIAREVGFRSYSGFYRTFKNFLGTSPAEFRRNYQTSIYAEPPGPVMTEYKKNE